MALRKDKKEERPDEDGFLKTPISYKELPGKKVEAKRIQEHITRIKLFADNTTPGTWLLVRTQALPPGKKKTGSTVTLRKYLGPNYQVSTRSLDGKMLTYVRKIPKE